VFPVKQDKTPYTKHGFKDATTDEATIRKWWGAHPRAGIARPTGDGFFVLDVDEADALKELVEKYGPLPPTIEVVTPRGGLHLYFLSESPVASRVGCPVKGLDVRGMGGYVVLPPSRTKDGFYEWRTAADEIDPAWSPMWLADLLEIGKRTNGAAPPVEGDIPYHHRDETLISMAGTMRRRGFSEGAILAALQVENRNRCKPPCGDAQIRKIAHSAARYEPAPSGTIDELSELLGLSGSKGINRRIDKVKVWGKSTRAHVRIELDDGSWITLDPIGAFTSPTKLCAELAMQAGATPLLKVPQLMKVLQLFSRLGDHYESVEVADRAWDLAADYLRHAAAGLVNMEDQASRWAAFCDLKRLDQTQGRTADIVLVDGETGLRYVRISWLADYLRQRTAPGEAAQMMSALEQSGWEKSGREGRIKATQPGFDNELVWAFYRVPPGWESDLSGSG